MFFCESDFNHWCSEDNSLSYRKASSKPVSFLCLIQEQLVLKVLTASGLTSGKPGVLMSPQQHETAASQTPQTLAAGESHTPRLDDEK